MKNPSGNHFFINVLKVFTVNHLNSAFSVCLHFIHTMSSQQSQYKHLIYLSILPEFTLQHVQQWVPVSKCPYDARLNGACLPLLSLSPLSILIFTVLSSNGEKAPSSILQGILFCRIIAFLVLVQKEERKFCQRCTILSLIATFTEGTSSTTRHLQLL